MVINEKSIDYDLKRRMSISKLIGNMNNLFVTIGIDKSLPTIFISHAHKDLAEGKLDDILGYIIRYCRVMIYLDENDEEPRNAENITAIEKFLKEKMNEADKSLITYTKRLNKSQWCEFEYCYLRDTFMGMKAVCDLEDRFNPRDKTNIKRYLCDFDVVAKTSSYGKEAYKVYSCKERNMSFEEWCSRI